MNKWLLLMLGLVALAVSVTGSTSQVDRIARAIATAEGFFVLGSRPNRNRNPGNLTASFGYQTLGSDGPFPIFATDTAGWAALKDQIRMMLDGSSEHYKPYMTIAEIAEHYTATEQAIWARNVANELGVSVDTQLQNV